MDLDAVLLNVQERDKWRLRVERLEATLAETRARRRKLEGRLRRVDRDIQKLREYSDALTNGMGPYPSSVPIHASNDIRRVPR
jgi:chromosome segregation ATPase